MSLLIRKWESRVWRKSLSSQFTSKLWLCSQKQKKQVERLFNQKKSKKRNLNQPESESGSWTVFKNQYVKKKLNSSKNQNVAEFKKKLNEHLVGNYRNEREELWVEYNKQPAEERPDLC